MFFWLFVTLLVLLIAYRKEISARCTNWVIRTGNEMRYEIFHVMLHPRYDADIIEFLKGICCPSVYYMRLVDCDIGKLSRVELVEKCPERSYARNTAEEVVDVELKLERDLDEDRIKALKDAEPSRYAYMTRLVREDIEYRKDRDMSFASAVE